tara:strand:+ start:923 stop:1129 length:207 start_codon:yes stop_codon:yes gene_type:complete
VKAAPPGTLVAMPMKAYSKSPVRVPAGQPQYQAINPQYQPPAYVKSQPTYVPVQQQTFYPTASHSATK